VIEANCGSASTRFVAVASRDAARSQAYAAKHDLPLAFGSYQELLDSPEVDAVHVALPVALHARWAAALRAGKHVLCGKPFALEPAEVTEAFDAAGSLVCAEGLMWRYHPQSGLDAVRRDQLELAGTEGRLELSDPWLCRGEGLLLTRDGRTERVPVDADGAGPLRHDEGDVYRLEFDAVGGAIETGAPLRYGKDDAVAQARVLSALARSAATGQAVEPGS
jgi:predicted dehydrogenase